MGYAIAILTVLFFGAILLLIKIIKNPTLAIYAVKLSLATIAVATADILILLTFILRSLI